MTRCRLIVVALIPALLVGLEPSHASESWTRVPTPNAIEGQHNFVQGLDCPTPESCWAVGYHYSPSGNKTLTMRWDGQSWSLAPSPNPEGHSLVNLTGVGCATPQRCWAVGYSYDGLHYTALILGWDGASWSIEPVEDSETPGSDFLYDVACASSSDCWAVGRHMPGALGGGNPGTTLIHHWDGTAWSIEQSPNALGGQSSQVVSVDCPTARDCWTVGYSSGPAGSRTLAMRWDGETWSVIPTPNSAPDRADALNGITCLQPHDCWAVGVSNGQFEQALAMRWDGASWSLVPIPSSGPELENVLFDVACQARNECWTAGYRREGTWLVTLIERWDGERWQIVPSPNSGFGETNVLTRVDCLATGCWSAGYHYGTGSIARTMALRRDGTPPPSGPGPGAPHIVDLSGDANLVSSQGGEQAVDVRTDPASIGGADLTGAWLETAYETVIERDQDGAVSFVRHVPSGLRVRVKTSSPAKPTFGPTLTYRVPVTIDGSCQAWLSFYVRGDSPGALDREGAMVLPQSGCASEDPVLGTLAFEGNYGVATYSFEGSSGLLGTGMELGPWSRSSVRIAAGNGTQQVFTAPAIDEGPPTTSFTIGSDVPDDIDCRVPPAHPACSG